ncbi:MAG: hypothetical protein H7Z75_10590 [Ferruginibacter sp.]|nr:hypothetical protein [Cytophagales bacterium]
MKKFYHPKKAERGAFNDHDFCTVAGFTLIFHIAEQIKALRVKQLNENRTTEFPLPPALRTDTK